MSFEKDIVVIDREKWDKLTPDEMYGYANRNMLNAENFESSLMRVLDERNMLRKELGELKNKNPNEEVSERNCRKIQESWDGELDSTSFCDTCKFNDEDEHYLRYCNKLGFPTFGMTISVCIDYKEKE